jgi:hypothetical protein
MFLSLLLFSSCEMMLRIKSEFIPTSVRSVSSEISVSSFSDNQMVPEKIESVQAPTIILMKGNNLVRGLPCFGENAIRAIMGEYKLEMPDDTIIVSDEDSPLIISSWLTSEFIYLSPELWKDRISLRNLRAMEMRDDESLYIVSSFPIAQANQEKWTILFSVPNKTIAAGINDATINRLIQNWTARLSYYISISQNESQISLPAVIAF